MVNTAEYVDGLIGELKDQIEFSGLPLFDAAWETALACVGWPYVFGAWGAECTVSERKKRLSYNPSHTTIRTSCKAFDGGTCKGCKWYPDGKRVRCFDCRGFTNWVLKQYGFDLQGQGATSQWNTAANWCAKGKVEDGIPDGVLVNLFIDKNGTKSHTGFYYNGDTCECSSGVQHFHPMKKNRWTHWAVAKCFEKEYNGIHQNPAENATITPTKPSVDKLSYPTIRRGDRGEKVRIMQGLLKELGYDIGSAGVDGDFGSATETALKKFQRANGLSVDGVCGPKTWAALLSTTPKEKRYSVTITDLSESEADALCEKYINATKKEMGT